MSAPVSNIYVVVFLGCVEDILLGLGHPFAVTIGNSHDNGVVFADDI